MGEDGGEDRANAELSAAFRDPPAALRPKVRWVWPGVAVDPAELTAQLCELSEAGFGGAEISHLQFGLPAEGLPAEVGMWGTPLWAARFQDALEAGERHGVSLDLTIGPGFPWGSPGVSGEHVELAQRELLRGERALEGPMRFEGVPPLPPPGLAPHGRLIAVTAARRRGVTPDGMILLDPESLIDLTSVRGADGRLAWDVPEGEWLLFGFWERPTGQVAKGAMPNVVDHPLVVDHLRRASAEAALAHLDDALIDPIGSARTNLRDLFEDSLELETAGVFWTPALPDEFRARRGYDLTPHLPLLPRPTVLYALDPADPHHMRERYDLPGAGGDRVRRDYYQTITDLWVDEHLVPMREWAGRLGMKTRVQPYGFVFDTLAVAKAVDVPETEDLFANTIDFWRTVASAAHLSGARTVSMEFGGAANADNMMTLRELKRRADKAFAAGVNQLVLHVCPYPHGPGVDWPGYTPWSSRHLFGGTVGFSDAWNSTNPQWPHVRRLADYMARAQAVLRSGRAVADVAVYRSVFGYRTHEGQIGTRVPLGVDLPEPPLGRALARAGMGFDFVDPGTLEDPGTHVTDGQLVVQSPGYRALVVDLMASRHGLLDQSDAMPGAVALRLAAFARQGLPIVLVGGPPKRGVTWSRPREEDAQVREAVVQLQQMASVRCVQDAADVPVALAELGVTGTLAFDASHEIWSTHRQSAHGDWWFLWNGDDGPVELTASFEVPPGRGPCAWDLWSGDRVPLGVHRAVGERIELPLRMAAADALLLGFDAPAGVHAETTTAEEVLVRRGALLLRSTAGGHVSATLPGGVVHEMDLGPVPAALEPAEWELRVEAVTPDGPESHRLRLSTLADFRSIPRLANVSGRGWYRTSVALDEHWIGPGRGAYLELGTVHGGVQVRVNGELATTACVAPARIDVGGLFRPGRNVLEVELTTTLRNRIDSLADQAEYAYVAARPERTQPSGLTGPVRFVPYVEAVVRVAP